MEKIEITISPDGSDVKVDVICGPGGAGCKDLSKPFIDAAGGVVTSDTAKPEMYQQPQVAKQGQR